MVHYRISFVEKTYKTKTLPHEDHDSFIRSLQRMCVWKRAVILTQILLDVAHNPLWKSPDFRNKLLPVRRLCLCTLASEEGEQHYIISHVTRYPRHSKVAMCDVPPKKKKTNQIKTKKTTTTKMPPHPSLESKALVSLRIVPPFLSSSICLWIS